MIEAGIVDQMVQVLPVLTKSYSTAMSLPVEESRATSKAASTEQGAGPDQTRETFIFLQNLSLFLSKICQVCILKGIQRHHPLDATDISVCYYYLLTIRNQSVGRGYSTEGDWSFCRVLFCLGKSPKL